MAQATTRHDTVSLLPSDQQMLTLDLEGRRLLARIISGDETGRLSLVVFDSDFAVRDKLENADSVAVEYVKVGLCRAVFKPHRVEDTAGQRAPMLLVHGWLGRVDSVQRRDNFRVRLAMPVELLMLKGSVDRPDDTPLEPTWRQARSVNISVEGLCIETSTDLFRGDVLSVRIHTEARPLEADARIVGPRPTPETSHMRQYGMQLIQIPRADQQLLTNIINNEERRGLAYRIGRDGR